MSIIEKLACSLGRREEVPNQELAEQIAATQDVAAVKELVANLSNKDKAIQSDCIKTLYEVAARKPQLVSGYANELIDLLDSKNNRMQWGAMSALSAIVSENPQPVYEALATIVAIADKGSVITRDHAVRILAALCMHKQYTADAFDLLVEQLLHAPGNQLPMYAELGLPAVNDTNRAAFLRALNSRLPGVESEAKRKRIELVMKKAGKVHK
ncbi:MAG: sister chromatid cohesion protein PDS5 [Bacteroidota bacterium]